MRYLTPEDAAQEVFGWCGARRGRRLMRLILSKEKRENRQIAIRGPGTGPGTRYLLTEAMLRLHFPELFAPQIDAIALELSSKVDELRATIGATVDERIAPQVQAMRSAHRALASEVSRLASSTTEGFSRTERRLAQIENRLAGKRP